MVKESEIQALAKSRKYVNVKLLSQEYGWSYEYAGEVIRGMWDRGKLVPVDQSFFTVPTTPGEIPEFARGNNNTRDIVLARLQENPEMGVTLNDLFAETGITKVTLRKALSNLEVERIVIVREATAGGSYGRKPLVWGFTEEAIVSRNDGLIAVAQAKLDKQKLKKAKRTKEASEPTEIAAVKLKPLGKVENIAPGEEPPW